VNVVGSITIAAANVTVNNVCVTESGNSGNMAVWVGSNATNLLLEHSTFRGAASSGIGVIDTGVWNVSNVPSVTGKALYIYNAAESWHGNGFLNDSYLQAGACWDCDGANTSHNEDVYLSDGTFSANHDTLLNSTGQTAIFFGDNNGGTCCIAGDNHWTVKNSLLAGGGWAAYWNAKSTSAGSSSMDIENNRWARCDGPKNPDGWGITCTTGADQFGYYWNIGYYGGPVDGYCGSHSIWTGNVYDDNNDVLGCD
jgi:hypothetical protein